VHRGYASAGSGIREITVKSTSWAMGVRRPGVVLVSLWNPVDGAGKPLNGKKETVQTKLCLYPDQIGTFLRYGMLFGLTFVLLVGRAALLAIGIVKLPVPVETPLLPTTMTSDKPEKFEDNPPTTTNDALEEQTHSSNSSMSSERGGLLARAAQNRAARNAAENKYAYPLVQHAGFYAPVQEEDRDKEREKGKVKVYGVSTKPKKKRKGLGLIAYEVRMGLGKVLVCGGMVYVWLVWRDRN
jgi:hypothetical protein